jgi:hypothetical protein
MPQNARMPIQVPSLDYIKARLEASRGDWPDISKKSKVPYFTMTNIVQGKVKNPRVQTVQALFNELERREGLTRRPRKGLNGSREKH